MRVVVVAIAALVISLFPEAEPIRNADPEAKRSQLQQRNIECPPVEADQCWLAVQGPATPEVFRDHMRAELRIVQQHDIHQFKISCDLPDRDRDRKLVGIGDKVGVVLGKHLAAVLGDCLLGAQLLPRVANPADELAISDALGVKNEIADFWCCHSGNGNEAQRESSRGGARSATQ